MGLGMVENLDVFRHARPQMGLRRIFRGDRLGGGGGGGGGAVLLPQLRLGRDLDLRDLSAHRLHEEEQGEPSATTTRKPTSPGPFSPLMALSMHSHLSLPPTPHGLSEAGVGAFSAWMPANRSSSGSSSVHQRPGQLVVLGRPDLPLHVAAGRRTRSRRGRPGWRAPSARRRGPRSTRRRHPRGHPAGPVAAASQLASHSAYGDSRPSASIASCSASSRSLGTPVVVVELERLPRLPRPRGSGPGRRPRRRPPRRPCGT